MQVRREWRTPEGMAPGDADADTDADVLVVFDLRVDSGLIAEGVAREVVNR